MKPLGIYLSGVALGAAVIFGGPALVIVLAAAIWTEAAAAVIRVVSTALGMAGSQSELQPWSRRPLALVRALSAPGLLLQIKKHD